jgi:hypothetical protein
MVEHHDIQQTCYMCEAKANSREHVPPRCFFPEGKDLPSGRDYRKNLISVPACKEHNLEKSTNDEYLFLVILAAGGNLAAQRLFSTKVMRAIRRKQSLLSLITADARPAIYGGLPTMAFAVDGQRFGNAVDRIARAIHFHQYQTKWAEEVAVASPTLIAVDHQMAQRTNEFMRALASLSGELLKEQPRFGENPEIFYYQIYRDEPLKRLLVRMVFYENVIVMASSWPEP